MAKMKDDEANKALAGVLEKCIDIEGQPNGEDRNYIVQQLRDLANHFEDGGEPPWVGHHPLEAAICHGVRAIQNSR